MDYLKNGKIGVNHSLFTFLDPLGSVKKTAVGSQPIADSKRKPSLNPPHQGREIKRKVAIK